MQFLRVLNFSRIGIAVLTTLQAISLGGIAMQPALAQALDFHDASRAPPSWEQFAKLVKYRFEESIAGDDEIATRFRDYLKLHRGRPDGPPPVLIVKAWLNPDGTVERVSFPAFADAEATKDLHTILTRSNIGEAPPPEMLQPLILRFSLPGT